MERKQLVIKAARELQYLLDNEYPKMTVEGQACFSGLVCRVDSLALLLLGKTDAFRDNLCIGELG